MWGAVGIETLRNPAPPAGELVVWVAPWQDRVNVDRAAREQLIDDVRRSSRASRNFAAIYFPQSSHAPWRDTIEDGVEHSISERGRAVFAHIDSWIGEIVDELDRLGELDRTLILVTGDHGVRTREEDPELPPGKIDAYTFQVPFLLYAPGIVEQTVEIPWLTSHIDVSPTLEALYGIETAPAMAQGAPIWEPGLANRTTFFWSGKFHGATGFHRTEKFTMWNRFYDEAFESSSLSFVGVPAAPPDSALYEGTVRQIQEMEAINRQWVSAVLRIAD
jgi:arylsulfatase A-like enzyme